MNGETWVYQSHQQCFNFASTTCIQYGWKSLGQPCSRQLKPSLPRSFRVCCFCLPNGHVARLMIQASLLSAAMWRPVSTRYIGMTMSRSPCEVCAMRTFPTFQLGPTSNFESWRRSSDISAGNGAEGKCQAGDVSKFWCNPFYYNILS